MERLWDRLLVVCNYSLYDRIRQETERCGGVIEDTEYGADVTLTVLTPETETENYVNQLVELSAGTVQGEKLDQVFRGMPVNREV